MDRNRHREKKEQGQHERGRKNASLRVYFRFASASSSRASLTREAARHSRMRRFWPQTSSPGWRRSVKKKCCVFCPPIRI